jgi:hypothetical protein
MLGLPLTTEQVEELAFCGGVQWDTSEHDWLEGRAAVPYLVRLIDDATRWSGGRFVGRDATLFNRAVLWKYLEKNERMVDVYTESFRSLVGTIVDEPQHKGQAGARISEIAVARKHSL